MMVGTGIPHGPSPIAEEGQLQRMNRFQHIFGTIAVIEQGLDCNLTSVLGYESRQNERERDGRAWQCNTRTMLNHAHPFHVTVDAIIQPIMCRLHTRIEKVLVQVQENTSAPLLQLTIGLQVLQLFGAGPGPLALSELRCCNVEPRPKEIRYDKLIFLLLASPSSSSAMDWVLTMIKEIKKRTLNTAMSM